MSLTRRSQPFVWAFVCLILIALFIHPAAAESTPTLQFSTYLGGSGSDYGEAIAVDDDGNIYVTGSGAADFPVTNPGTDPGSYIYVTKFDPSGKNVIYSVFLGSGSGYAITADGDGYAYVAGEGSNISTTGNAIQPTPSNPEDAFFIKLSPSGEVTYATYLGGNGTDLAMGIAVDTSRNIYIAGSTTSTNFPTQNPYQNTIAGGTWDTFLTRINADGTSMGYSTYLGGSRSDNNRGVVVDASGNAYVTGYTSSSNFPSLSAYQPQHAAGCLPVANYNCQDVFVARFNAAGGLVYSTYLGGSGNMESGESIAVDGDGNAYIVGSTDSSDFPTTVNAYQMTRPYQRSAFVAKLSSDGSILGYSTYLGGTTDYSSGMGIDVDDQQRASITGLTAATDFPTVDAIQATKKAAAGTSDTFIARLNTEGSALLFSTYWGGSNEDAINFSPSIVETLSGTVYVAGTTFSTDFPILNAYQPDYGGSTTPSLNFDAFVSELIIESYLPPDPTPSLPGANAIRNYFTTDTPTLTWTPITWATHYHVQVSKDKFFTGTPDFDDVTMGNELFMTTDSLDNGLYYWRVQAQKADGSYGGWSPVESFTVDTD